MVMPLVPFASANVIRKTGHANQNNWHIAIFDDPLCQQAAPRPQAAWFQSLHILLTTRKKKVSESSSGANRPVVLDLYIVQIIGANVAIQQLLLLLRCKTTARPSRH